MNKNTMVKYNTYIEDTTIGNGVNPLVELVIHKEKWYEFSKRFFIYGLKKYMMKYYTPSFYFLLAISDFILSMENICLFSNSKKDSNLYAYRNVKSGVSSFRVNSIKVNGSTGVDCDYSIEYTMYKSEDKINISIKRNWGDQVRTNITFVSGQPMMLSDMDQVLFDSIITNTMKEVVSLLESCRASIKPITLQDNDDAKDNFTHSA